MRKLGKKRAVRAVAIACAAVSVSTAVIATPAQAAGGCGNRVNARVSLYYTACDYNESGGRYIRGNAKFQNNHGSAVDVYIETATQTLSGSTWSSPRQRDIGHFTLPVNVTYPLVDDYIGCTLGQTLRYGLRMQQNNGTWAAWSWGPGVRCV